MQVNTICNRFILNIARPARTPCTTKALVHRNSPPRYFLSRNSSLTLNGRPRSGTRPLRETRPGPSEGTKYFACINRCSGAALGQCAGGRHDFRKERRKRLANLRNCYVSVVGFFSGFLSSFFDECCFITRTGVPENWSKGRRMMQLIGRTTVFPKCLFSNLHMRFK